MNPAILRWARERNGLSIDELAKKVKREPDEVRMWEDGTLVPSYACLEELAYRHLKIPLAVFYFPEPPPLDNPEMNLEGFQIMNLQDYLRVLFRLYDLSKHTKIL